ncbi:trypsin-like peptidase domain-containing protein [Actinoplanes sp. NBC_00393]|uniref:trypsin-like peptidase domain-containing protein n=1 Tax=Actinoplanes sp. NBC_00393 TaxID=2975953 RepID=UPI002E1FA31C
MELSDDVVKGLSDLLRECTARITPLSGTRPAGAAFFVSSTLLVTNRHVVEEAVEVTVQPFGAEPRTGTVLPPSESHPDLDIALVEVDADPAIPAVLLHRDLDIGAYRLAGFPREDFYEDMAGGLEVVPADGHPRYHTRTGTLELFRLTGVQIKPGFSGGPVLNTGTGAVSAVCVYSEDPDFDLGGGAIPVNTVLDAYPQLAKLAAEPPEAIRRCRELLGRAHWESLGLVWSRDQQVDIYLNGNRSQWRIGIRPDDLGPVRTVRDLGDDMSEVLVGWARSSGRRDEPEVRLLGRLLSAAMFPAEVADRLPRPAERSEDPVLIRLHVDPSGPLADLPWEFATDPKDPERFLAATDGYAFVRVNSTVPRGGGGTLRRNSPDEQVGVFAIVVQPDDITRWPPVVHSQNLMPWPSSAEIEDGIAGSVGAARTAEGSAAFRYDLLTNPTLAEIKLRQSSIQADVVHYMGFGYQEPESDSTSGLDRAWIACSPGRRMEKPQYHRAREFLQVIAALQPSLVILEFGLPPVDQPYDMLGKGCQPIGPAVLSAATELGFDTMVCTRPLHPHQYERFNQFFYPQLAAGRTVEQAVQEARQALMTDSLIDFAGFGWFTVTTGNNPWARFFERPAFAETRGRHPRPSRG